MLILQTEYSVNGAAASPKNSMGRDIGVLALLLIIYNLISRYMIYPFYYVSYRFFAGEFTGSWNKVVEYFNDHRELNDSTTFQMTANIVITVFSAAITLLIARCFGISVRSYLKPSQQGGKTGLKWMPSCFVFNMISSTIIAYFTNFLNSMGVSVPSSDFSIKQPSVLAVVMQFAYVIVLAPVFEEIIYRGLIIKVISPYSKTGAVLVSALSFGLMHGNIPQAASAFCTGVIYAIIALKCGSIFPTVIIHSLNNMLVNSPELLGALGINNSSAAISTIEIIVALIGFLVWFVDYKFMKYEPETDSRITTAAVKKVMTHPMIIVYFSLLLFFIIRAIILANAS